MKKLSDLIQDLEIVEKINFNNHEIINIQYDSRKVTTDSCFVALKGTNSDGHDFIHKAIELGANTIICENIDKNLIKSGITIIIVSNTRKSLAQISQSFFNNPSENLINIAITGTNGKTTLTFLIKQLLEKSGIKTGIIGTTGIYIGDEKIEATHTTPESLELAELFALIKSKGAKAVVMECSSHALHQFRTFGIKFKAALFTNLTHDHLDYHNTMDEYASAKKILFDSLQSDSIAILNGDDKFSSFMVSESKSNDISFVGRNLNNNFLITDERLSLENTQFTISHINFNFNILTNLLGRFNIDNSSMAFVLALKLGIDVDLILSTFENIQGAPGRMDKIKLKNGAFGIIDYAHTPDALEKALLSCRDAINASNLTNSKLISIFGCGGDRDKTKRPKMGNISTRLADYSIITSDNPRTENPEQILNDIIQGIDKNNTNYQIEINRQKAIELAFEKSKENDIILIAGKGHENYQIIGNTKYHFDDKEELTKFI